MGGRQNLRITICETEGERRATLKDFFPHGHTLVLEVKAFLSLHMDEKWETRSRPRDTMNGMEMECQEKI